MPKIKHKTHKTVTEKYNHDFLRESFLEISPQTLSPFT